jgi:uncharacterized cupredoxin-like copper-binding protein
MHDRRVAMQGFCRTLCRIGLFSASAFFMICAQLGPVSAEDYEPVIVLVMGDHFFEVAGQDRGTPIKVKAGRVYYLQIRNDGKQEHNIEWGRDVLTKDGVPDRYATNLIGYVPVKITHELLDVTVDGLRDMNMQAGQRVELELIFPESARGEWEIGCFRPGHYDDGMRVPIIIE